jgi:hypothetical protein
MISRQTLKEIIVSNEEFILNRITNIVPRQGLDFPHKLNKVVIFYGVRRGGKTYILYDLFRKNKGASFYIDFEDERLQDFKTEDFQALKEVCLELKPNLLGKNIIFLLDEIHSVSGWEKFVRRVVERENIKVFVTGSSSKVMPKEIHTSLRGRSWGIEISPFSFKELLFLEGMDIKNKTILYGLKKYPIKKYFYEYLKWGGFPEVLLLKSDIEKRKIIKEYLGAMFFKDLVERFNITNVHLLTILMEKLLSSFSLKFSLTSFYKQYKQKIPFSKDTLFLYYKYFLKSMLISEVKKFSESSYKRIRNPSKVYVIDNGICRKVTSDDYGRALENIVFLALKKHSQDIFYFEEEGECDFIVKDSNGNFIPYQVTYELNKKNEEREIKGLIEACRRLSVHKGTLLTFDQRGRRKIEGIDIEIIPVWQWILIS